jgi:hypothetical protein
MAADNVLDASEPPAFPADNHASNEDQSAADIR